MDFLSADDLLGCAKSDWGIGDAPEYPAVRELIETHTETMRRIHDILYLTRTREESSSWFHDESKDGPRPLHLLGMGEAGMKQVEARLIAEFRRAAPPDIFSSESTAERDPLREIRVLSRLLYERVVPKRPTPYGAATARGGEALFVHNPLLCGRALVMQPSLKIPRAIDRLSEAYGTFPGEAVVAFRDLLELAARDPVVQVRVRAARAAAALVGHPKMADLLTAMREDDDPTVRETALAGLIRSAHDREMHHRIATFSRDNMRELRDSALTALIDKHDLDPAVRRSLRPLVFDSAPEVRTRARWAYSDAEIAEAVDDLCAAAAAGKPMNLMELKPIAIDPSIEPVRRADVFRRRFSVLCGRADGSEDAAVITLRALASWRDVIPTEVWEAAYGVVRRWGSPAEKVLPRVLEDRPAEDIWPLLQMVLRRPVPPGGSRIRMDIGEVAGRVVRELGTESSFALFCGILHDPAVDETARAAVLNGLTRFEGSDRPLAPIRRLLDDPAVEPRLKRVALRTLRALADRAVDAPPAETS